MSLESKIDDIKETLYEMRPVVARLEESSKAVELRLGFIEIGNAHIDERVSHLEKHIEPKNTPWRFSFKEILEMLAALPIAAHLIPSLVMFLVALVAFVHEYVKTNHHP